MGFSFFSALEVPRDDHTSTKSQESVVHHERAPSLRTGKRQVSHSALYRAGKQRFSVTPEYTFVAAGVLRVVFFYDLASGVLLVLCSIVTMLTRVAGCILVKACFTHFLPAVRPGIRAITNVVLFASRFSPLGVDAHALLSHVVSRPVRST